jgi:hypothetical protein
LSRKAEGEQGRADSVEYSGGDFWTEAQQWKRGKGGGERILFEGRVVGILMVNQSLCEVQGPPEVGGVLVVMLQQDEGKRAGGKADEGCD